MKKIEIDVIKTEEQFLRNYTLHDIACHIGNSMLKHMGFEYKEYGEDRRYEKVWEKGEDKPDHIIIKEGKPIALLDWKGKSGEFWIMNKRAYDAYVDWKSHHKLPIFVAIAILDIENKKCKDFRYIEIPTEKACIISDNEIAWDGNVVIKFKKDCMKPLTNFLNEF